jgi:hypothetical protein
LRFTFRAASHRNKDAIISYNDDEILPPAPAGAKLFAEKSKGAVKL